MIIEDDELRGLFQAESGEHLQVLEQGLLRLEADPADEATLDESFRAAHSLKGAARMLQVGKVEAIAHRFEDVLGKAKSGKIVLLSETADRLYQALDAIREFCQEAITGERSVTDLEKVISQLDEQGPPCQVAELNAADSESDDEDEPRPATGNPPATAEIQTANPLQADIDREEPSEIIDEKTQDMLIEDDEFRSLFEAETDNHFDVIEQGLKKLERALDDRASLEEVLAAAQKLKNASRSLDVPKVAAVAERYEQLLSQVKRGTLRLNIGTIGRWLQSLGGLREFRDEALSGKRAAQGLEAILSALSGAAAVSIESKTETDKLPKSVPVVASSRKPSAEPAKEIAAVLPTSAAPDVEPTLVDDIDEKAAVAEQQPGMSRKEAKAASKATSGSPPSYSIDTIRVQAQKLDVLMSYAGELMVARGRISNRVGQIERLTELWEKWNRTSYSVRSFANGEIQSLERDLKQVIDYLSQDRERLDKMGQLIRELENSAKGDQARIDLVATNLDEGIRTIRLLPMSTLFNLFPRMVRDLSKDQAKEVVFVMEGSETAADKRILEEMKDPLMHILRNAIDHGIELPDHRERIGKPAAAHLWLRAFQTGTNVFIEIEDDGGGIDVEAIKRVALKRRVCSELELAEMSDHQVRQLIFSPGFSTKAIVTDVSGRGVGLDVVRENVDRLRGKIEVESVRGQGSKFRLVFPLTLATRRVLIAGVGGHKYAIPVESVVTTRLVRPDEILSLQGQKTIVVGGIPISVECLSDFLELNIRQRVTSNRGKAIPDGETDLACIVLRVDGDSFGFMVDELIDEQEVVLKSHGAILRRVRNVSGSTILQSGEVCIALNPQDLIKSARGRRSPSTVVEEEVEIQDDRPRLILLAEDSIVTRTQEKRILESAGYEVVTAVDGLDALNKLNTRAFDAVISDVEMPNLTGLDFTEKVRQIEKYRNLPIILVTSLATDADRKRGMDVGADAYLTKPGFDQTVFLQTLKRFI